MSVIAEMAEQVRKDDPRTVEEWMARINAQFDAIDAMIADSKDILRKWHTQRELNARAA